jgi:hypothetical protein
MDGPLRLAINELIPPQGVKSSQGVSYQRMIGNLHQILRNS